VGHGNGAAKHRAIPGSFCCAIACFSIGSALCGAADSLTSLVLFRVIQGLGALFIIDVREDKTPGPFDVGGFVLLALGLTGLLGGLETAGKALVAVWLPWTMAGVGALAMGVYYVGSRRKTWSTRWAW
jgi:hypothetical protein